MERMDIFSKDLLECFSHEAFREVKNATHVVVEIDWGANAMITLDYSNDEQDDVTVIQGSLQAAMSKIVSVSGKVEVDLDNKEKKKNLNFSIKVYADAASTEDAVPQTVEEAMAYMKKMPTLVKQANNGRGKPLQYTLLPLSTIENYLNIANITDRLVKQLDEASIKRVVALFDDIAISFQKVNDLYNDCLKYQYCLPNERLDKIKNLLASMTSAEAKLRADLNSSLIKQRSGENDAITLDQLVSTFNTSEASHHKCLSFVAENVDLVEKMQYAKGLCNVNVKYIGKNSPFEAERRAKMTSDELFILFLGLTEGSERKRSQENQRYFHQLSVANNTLDGSSTDENKKNNKIKKIPCMVVDFDVRPEILLDEGVPEGVRICFYKKGKYVSTDVLLDLEDDDDSDYAAVNNGNVTLTSILSVVDFFKKTVSKHQVPESFTFDFANALQQNESLERELLIKDALPYWNKNSKEFSREWNLGTIIISLQKLKNYFITFREWGQKVFERKKLLLTQKTLLEVNTIIEKPKVLENDLPNFYRIIYPYVLQMIRMWGCHALYASNIDSLIETSKHRTINRRTNQNSSENKPTSRFDFISYLLGTSDCLVASDIIRITSKFLMAMPLVVRDLQMDRYVLLEPLYTDVIIKWEVGEGKIIENYLFQSPFKMIICVRVGDNGKRPGKSIILNQLIRKENFFSNRSEPGAIHGKPCTLEGSVEFTWLTIETCSDTLWTKILQPHYAKKTNELILLANLHGDINNFADFINIFESFSPIYMVFVMPSATSKSEWDVAKVNSAAFQNAFLIFVDPEYRLPNLHDQDTKDLIDPFTFDTGILTDDVNMLNVTEPLGLAVEASSKETKVEESVPEISKIKRLVYAEEIYHPESQAVLEFIKEHTCKASKKQLATSRLMDLFLKIFQLSPFEIRKAIAHLEAKLSSLSDIESLKARQRVQDLRKQCHTLIGSEAVNQTEALKTAINEALTEVNDINFGLEHFFRHASNLFQNGFSGSGSSGRIISELHSQCADLLLAGNAIELLNGDDQELSFAWISAICNSINKKHPNMKVFVVSIIGLQSSGKSTLLNALFSCKFAVSVGRCSRGLFMRLAFLHEHLRSDYGFDAFLIIDTEGLGSPEKMSDSNAAQKDRRMATFAMGISNLTIINVMGEAIREMTEILQIAIVAMARLEKSDMASDILLVQHLLEKNALRSSDGKNSFCDALQEAFKITEKRSTDIGILNVACLRNLIQRIQAENFLKQFHPLKDGSTVYAPPSKGYHEDVVDLYKTILDVSQEMKNYETLSNWCKSVGPYWRCAKYEKFASNFKNTKELVKFLDHEQKMEGIRTAISCAYVSHCTRFEGQMRQQINQNNYDKEALMSQIKFTLTGLPGRCSVESVNNNACEECKKASKLIADITRDVKGLDTEKQTATVIFSYSKREHDDSCEKLSKFFDAIIIEDKFCEKYGEFINIQVKELLDSNKTGQFTNEQRKKEVASIWEKLKKLATKEKADKPVQARIKQEISSVYQNTETFMTRYETKVEIESFEKENAFEAKYSMSHPAGGNKKLSKPDAQIMVDTFVIIAQESFRNDCNFKGFDPTMISELKSKIDNALKKFQMDFKKTFDAKYHWMVHAYTLQIFADDMEQKQTEWDSKHNPHVILTNKKETYMKEIDTRLQLGFTAVGDGHIFAQTLCNAMHKQAKSCVEQQLLEDFRKQEWTRQTESVRLKYLEELAKEVLEGKKTKAVNHFLQPAYKIESWFKEMADKYDKEQMKSMYIRHFEESKSGIKNVLIQKVMEKAENYLQEYICKTDETFSLSRSSHTNEDNAHFMETVLNVISEFECVIHEIKDIITPPSKNEKVMNLIGCTECCPMCRALCWMGRGHADLNPTGTKAALHRSCHQPEGLGLICYRDTRAMCCTSCQSNEDFKTYIYRGNDMTWADIKKLHPQWSFENHHNTSFQEIMNWFMGMLHEDLSKERENGQPANADELAQEKCVNLDIDKILSDIHVRLLG